MASPCEELPPCSGLACLFIDPAAVVGGGLGAVHLISHVLAYGYVLAYGANLIAHGSELLACVYDPGLVGGLLLPVMGAVPDAAIVLFSGLGDNAQEQLKVGVGTLAGSTVMLLTLPVLGCVIAGRVDLEPAAGGGGALRARYRPAKGEPKLRRGASLADTVLRSGVQLSPSVRSAAAICVLTSLTYLVIQGPAFALRGADGIAAAESAWALAGLVVASLALVAYSAFMVTSSNAIEQQEALIVEARKRQAAEGAMSMLTLLQIEAAQARRREDEGRDQAAAAAVATGAGGMMRHASVMAMSALSAGGARLGALAGAGGGGGGAHAHPHHAAPSASTELLRSLFARFDLDGNGELDRSEVKQMLSALRMRVSGAELSRLMDDFGGHDKKVQMHEFEALVHRFAETHGAAAAEKRGHATEAKAQPPPAAASPAKVAPAAAAIAAPAVAGTAADSSPARAAAAAAASATPSGAGQLALAALEGDDEETAAPRSSSRAAAGAAGGVTAVEDEEGDEAEAEGGAGAGEEEEEEEEEGASGTPMQIKLRAFVTLIAGLAICVVFSDPMVELLTELGNRWDISPFYVSFIVTPIVSNASELISAGQFSARKTRRSIDMSFAQLWGAATVNNTLCLGVFLVLVYARGLAWQFSAETISILLVEALALALMLTARDNVVSVGRASLIALLFPLALVVVWLLENVAGLD